MSHKSDIKKGGGSGDDRDSNTWMTTFSDLCTLLLTFFVLLFSMSSMDDQKLKISYQNFGGSSGILFFRKYREISSPMETMIQGFHRSMGAKVAYGEKKTLKEGDIRTKDLKTLGGLLFIERLKDGVKLAFGDRLLFPPGSAEIREEVMPVLYKIAKFISISGYQVYIDGHTDNIPFQTDKYTSNEELSIARARSVRAFLLRAEDISPDAIAVTGYGAMKPIAANNSPEGRAKNRRVEVILKNQRYF